MNQYEKRNKLLRSIGYSSYTEYLLSIIWIIIRSEIMKRDYYRCRSCDSRKKIQVHHISYSLKVLKGEDCSKLITLCSKCHREVEYTRTNRKVSLNESFKRLKKKIPKLDTRKSRKNQLVELRIRKRIEDAKKNM